MKTKQCFKDIYIEFLKIFKMHINGALFLYTTVSFSVGGTWIVSESAKYVRPNEMSSKITTGPVKVPL